MPSNYYVAVTTGNGYKYCIPDIGGHNISDVIDKYIKSYGQIRVIALGANGSTNGRYVIIFEKNRYMARGPQGLYDKLNKLQKNKKIDNIKQITFGPGDTYAIVMKNGYCFGSTYHSPDGPWEAIEKNQGKISYVSMNMLKQKWIVGIGSNGWSSRGLDNVHDCLLPKMKSLKYTDKRTIHFIEIGLKSYYIKHSGGSSMALAADANEWCCENDVQTIALF